MAPIIAYAARTGTKRNLDALRVRGWRLLVSATGVHRTEGFEHIGIDNGAWTAYQRFLKGLAPTPLLDKRAFIQPSTWLVDEGMLKSGLISMCPLGVIRIFSHSEGWQG